MELEVEYAICDERAARKTRCKIKTECKERNIILRDMSSETVYNGQGEVRYVADE